MDELTPNVRDAPPGNTRSKIGTGWKMAVTFSQTTMEVTPILQVDLGYYSPGNGSAQLLADGNYFFLPAIIPVDDFKATDAFSLEVNSTPDYGNAGIILNLQGPEQYRGWQVPNLYTPPTT